LHDQPHRSRETLTAMARGWRTARVERR
jgi:hypothetical protein